MGGGTIFKSVTKKDKLNLELIIPTIELADKFKDHMEPILRQLEVLFDKMTISAKPATCSCPASSPANWMFSK